MTRDLERLWWRYRNGVCSANRLEWALHSEHHRLLAVRAELEGRREELRNTSGPALLRLDERLDAALTSLNGCLHREALTALREAEAVLRHLKTADEAFSSLEDARREWEELLAREKLEAFGQFPTLRVPGRLVACALEFLAAEELQKALFVIRLLGLEITRLGVRERVSPARARNLLAWLDLTDTAAADPESVEEIRRLLTAGYANLAESLGGDLEVHVAAEVEKKDRRLRALVKTRERAAEVERSVANWITRNA
jgi:hypothetical protein